VNAGTHLEKCLPQHVATGCSAVNHAKVIFITQLEAKKSLKKHCIKQAYGLSVEEYTKLVEEHYGKCAICGANDDPLQVDHCHDTGKVRGLLCGPCNRGIGQLKDNIDTLKGAVLYLQRFV